VSQAFVDACTENQIRRNDDFNGPEQEGAGHFQVTQFRNKAGNGERLHPVMDRNNLTVITGAHATAIKFARKRATGVSYGQKGTDHTVAARREVILCGGAFNSPQLLILASVRPTNWPSIRFPLFTTFRASAVICRTISTSS